jgi:hypothetical protein
MSSNSCAEEGYVLASKPENCSACVERDSQEIALEALCLLGIGVYGNGCRRNQIEEEEGGQEDEVAKDLECFLNQPNINMTIPWIYQIYKSVKSGGGGGGEGHVIVEELTWDEEE